MRWPWSKKEAVVMTQKQIDEVDFHVARFASALAQEQDGPNKANLQKQLDFWNRIKHAKDCMEAE